MNKKAIDALLDKAKTNSRRGGAKCKCCNTPGVLEILDRWLERLDSGDQGLPTLRWVHSEIMIQMVSYGSLRNHLMKCLSRNPLTGAKNGK